MANRFIDELREITKSNSDLSKGLKDVLKQAAKEGRTKLFVSGTNQDLFSLVLNEINKLESNGFRVDLNFYFKHPSSITIYWGKQNDN